MADEAPNIRIERKGKESRLYLTGDWIAHETGLRNEEEIRKLLSDAQTRKLRLDVTGVGRWDSALVMFVRSLKDLNDNLPESDKASLILSDLPNPVLRLLSLAETEIPGMATTTSPSIEPPEYQLLISAETFEAQPDSNVRLAARWNILDGKTRKNLAAERTTIEEMVESSDDAGLVEAMNRAVTKLAQQIAEQIKSLNRNRMIRSGKNS